MQLIVSAVLDRFGALGLEQSSIGWKGAVGMLMLIGGTLLVTTR
jgi:uncharacterized membrane protein YdcZ (DUF606 family)